MLKTSIGFDPEISGRANQIIAHGALTNSKRPETFVKGVYPTHLTRGQGCYVWDTKNNRYIDFICGLGSSLLGYADQDINEAIARQLSYGATLSLGSTFEVEVAEKVKECFPSIEKLRFLKTGSEACNAAIRIARAATSRKMVLSDGYHGWGDEFTSLTPPANGVCVGHFNNIRKLDDLAYLSQDVAAVIIEPIITDISDARIAILRALRKTCTELGIVLIFDEIITGCRVPGFSVATKYGIEPDIILLGKAIANGLPLSVVGGKSSVMDADYFVSSTFAGDTLSLASCKKTLELLQAKTKFDINYLWERAAVFNLEINSIWPEGLRIEGYPTRGVLTGAPIVKALFMQEAIKAGLLFGPSVFINFHHVNLFDPILSVIKDILIRIKTGMVRLDGEMPQTPFAQRARS